MATPGGAKFTMKRRGVGELLRSPEIAAHVSGIAEEIAKTAEAMAPVGGPGEDDHPGLYKESFIVLVTRRGGRKKKRAAAYVINTAPHAAHVEYGAKGGRGGAHHTLLNAAIAARLTIGGV